ncbi:MAG: FMN-binding protein [bacterium]|nr:FMN-binding protein [bacterium]
MKKGILYISVAVFYAVYVVLYKTTHDSVTTLGISSSVPSMSAPSSMMGGREPMTGTPMMGVYRDGQYTGDSVYAYYGYVKVKAIVSGGKITDVQFLDYPNDQSTSRMINAQATRYLTQETIQKQSGNVDIISGATFTSQAFITSLASALVQAKN